MTAAEWFAQATNRDKLLVAQHDAPYDTDLPPGLYVEAYRLCRAWLEDRVSRGR